MISAKGPVIYYRRGVEESRGIIILKLKILSERGGHNMKIENFVREGGHNLKIDIFGSLFNDFEKFSPAAPIQHNMIANGSFLFQGTHKIYDLKNFRLLRAI